MWVKGFTLGIEAWRDSVHSTDLSSLVDLFGMGFGTASAVVRPPP